MAGEVRFARYAGTRNQLHMLGNMLIIWQRFGLGAFADRRAGADDPSRQSP